MTVSPDQWRRIEELFYESLDLAPETRSTFLDERCGGDLELKQEVESLLNSAGRPLSLLEQPVQEAAHAMTAEVEAQTGILFPGAKFERYEVISPLGTGGMSRVYLAQDVRLRRKVALKTLKPELTADEDGLRRFEREALAVSALNHPNILTIYEFGQFNGIHFLASEFVEGSTIREKLSHGRLALDSVLDIASQIGGALAAAHASGIIHRDIKPANIIVRSDGLVKVLDFGIAKLTETPAAQKIRSTTRTAQNPATMLGFIVGTAGYMSPEQARGLPIDPRSDLFSLGAVLYEMGTGRMAFKGKTVSDVIAEILKTEPPPLREVAPETPAGLQAIISRAMMKDRDARYQSAEEFLKDLKDLRNQQESRSASGNLPTLTDLNTPSQSQAGRLGTTGVQSNFATDAPSRTSYRRIASLAILLALLAGAGYYALVSRTSTSSTSMSQARSLAILPFRNLRPDASTDFLEFSLADAIITKLGNIGSLTVRPSFSVDKYRGQSIDPRKVASDLNVDTLLTGSFMREGDDLRITAQLIAVKQDKILWRDEIDLKYGNLLRVQDLVSQQIVKGLELNLTPVEAQSLKPETPINPQAYEYYLRGVDLYSLNDFPSAIGMLEKSAEIAPNYAPTWAHLGRAYTTNASLQFGGRDQYSKAQDAYEKAVALNPNLAEPRVFMANLLTDTGRVEQAVLLLRTALQNSPTNAEVHWELGYAYRFSGMLEESVAECQRARQNNPEVKINSSALNAYLYLGQYDKFMQSLPSNDAPYILFYRGLGEYYLNHHEQAAKDFDRAYAQDPALLPAQVGKALSYSIHNQREAGLALLRQAENRIEERGVGDAEGMYKVAQAYAVLGDKKSALHMFHHTVEGGFFCYPYFLTDPLMNSLRKEPEFDRLLEQARVRHAKFRAKFF